MAIARALMLEPPALLVDEPTSSLDAEMLNEVLWVIRDLAHRRMTLVCVTHEMGFAREVADRVLFMDHGVVLEGAAPRNASIARSIGGRGSFWPISARRSAASSRPHRRSLLRLQTE